MPSLYAEDEMLMLSGIQHFAFCPRQWWLITIEQAWADNHLTALGQLMHQRVNDPEQSERRGSIVTLRAMPIASHRLGIYGVSDAVELHPSTSDQGYRHPRYPGCWEVYPVEYKRGAPKSRTNADKLQLCAEAICLEEMYHINIPIGYLYYGETRHRLEVPLTQELRDETQGIIQQMHKALSSAKAIAPIQISGCRNCSLQDLCWPILSQRELVANYYARHKIFTK